MKKQLLFALLVLIAVGASAQNHRKWDFTKWSEQTVANLAEEATKGVTEGTWSDTEKANGDNPQIGKCYWSYGDNIDENGYLMANGSVIAETEGLVFNTGYTGRRSLAVAVDYPSTSLGDYAGPQYLWLGGGNAKSASARLLCFTIPKVKIGQKITVVAESHKPSDARGISLFVNTVTDDANQIGESFKPTTQDTYTWQDWTLPEGVTADGDVVDILVYNTNGCHIYSIEVGEDEVIPVAETFTAQTDGGLNMQFRVVSEDDKTCEVYAAPYESGVQFVPAVKKSTSGKVIVPAEVNGYKVIGLSSWCFYSCASISEMVLPETIGYIGESAFRMATGLQYINIPEGIGTIGERTFSGCTQLRTIKLPEGLTTLGPAAFANTYLLETVILPSTLTSISKSAFQHTRLLQSVTVKMETPIELPEKNFDRGVNPVLYVPMISKAAYEASATWSQLFTGGIVGYYRTDDVFKATTPQGVEMQFRVLDEDEKTCEVYTEPYEEGKSFSPAINKDFQGELVIPEEIEGFRVTAIGSWSFRSCKGITTATLPATITRIEGSVFRSCDNLASVNIPEGVTFIGESAFMGCPINIISLPSTLKEMEMYAFRNKNEESATSYVIAYMPEPCKAHRLALGGNISSSTLYVPVGTKEAYAAAECFQKFKKILEIGETDEETATTDVVYAPTVSIKAGEQAKLTLKLNTNESYGGYQMRLVLPEGVKIATDEEGDCLLEKAIDNSSLMLQAAEQGDGSYIIIAFDMNGKAAVNTGDADLLSMTLVANESLAAGEYNARIEDIVLATGSGSANPADATSIIKVEAVEQPEQAIVSAENVETEAAKEVTLPIFLNNQSDITAFYFDLTLPKGITVAESEGQLKAELVNDYAGETMLLLSTPLSGNTYRFIATPLTQNGTFKANAGHVMNVTISVGEALSSGVYTAKIEVVKLVAIETADSPAWRAVENLSNLTSFATITVKGNKAIMGDVNADMAVDVEDVVGIVNKILGEPAANFNSAAADINGDGKIDVDDVVAVVNIILDASANARKQD